VPPLARQAPFTQAPEGEQSVSVAQERRTHWLAAQSNSAGQSAGALHALGAQWPVAQTNPVPSP
jgi:hypothetical protein